MGDLNETEHTATRYEKRTVYAIRGLESRARDKAENEGWEFVGQDAGALRSTLHFQRAKKKTPRWMFMAGGAVALLLVAAVTLGVLFGDDDLETTAAATTTPSSAPRDSVEVPDVAGLAGDEAESALEEAGFVVRYEAGDESVVVASNWKVVSQVPARGTASSKGDTVTLTVELETVLTPTPSDEAAAPSAAPPAAANTTPSGLDFGWASTACQQRGDQEFPYGFKGHTIVGLLAQEVQGDEIYMKFEADITNGFGAERKANVECSVGGTNGAPQVTYFIAY
jgi:hypothetical protein